MWFDYIADKVTRLTKNPDPASLPTRVWGRVLQLGHAVGLYRLSAQAGSVQYDTDRILWVHPRDYLTRRLTFAGYHEYNEENFIRLATRPGMTVLDIGANIGLYTVLCAKRVGQAGAVHSFEPVLGNYELLVKNVEANGYAGIVMCNRLCVSDKPGETLEMAVCETHAGISHVASGEEAATVAEDAPRQSVQTVSVDAYVAKHCPKGVDLIKLDVEGWEAQVIRGACCTLQAFSPVILCEFNSTALHRAGSSSDELRRQFHSLGYGFFSYTHYSRTLHEYPFTHGDEQVTLVVTKDGRDLGQRLGLAVRGTGGHGRRRA